MRVPNCSMPMTKSSKVSITPCTPGTAAGVDRGALGTKSLSGGLTQVTYHGKALYLYGLEAITQEDGAYGATGSGEGVGGFKLVTP